MVLNSYFVIVCFFVNNDFHVFARHICPRAPHRSSCVRPFCFSNKLNYMQCFNVLSLLIRSDYVGIKFGPE